MHLVPVSQLRLTALLYICRFSKELAAEALRRNENDTQKALDDLTNPETNAVIQASVLVLRSTLAFKSNYYICFNFQTDIELKKRKRLRQAADAAMQQLIAMGFPRAAGI